MKRVLRWLGILVGFIILLLVIVGGYVYAQSNAIFNKTYEVTVFDYTLPDATDDLLAEGERIYTTRGCVECHGDDGGGAILVEDPALGRIAGTNLTRGHYDYTIDDYIRGIMYGVGYDGRGLIVMPSTDWVELRAEDLDALLVYMDQLPPVDNSIGGLQFGPLGRALIVFNQFPIMAEIIDPANVGLVDVEPDPTIEFGEYLANNCTGCHGLDLAGQTVPGTNDISANLTPHETGLADWSLEDFDVAMRTGVTPDGRELDPVQMPWTAFASLTDTEIEAMYLYFQSLDPIAAE